MPGKDFVAQELSAALTFGLFLRNNTLKSCVLLVIVAFLKKNYLLISTFQHL